VARLRTQNGRQVMQVQPYAFFYFFL
jgi:hypothetical protein